MLPKFKEIIQNYATLDFFDEVAVEIAEKIDNRILPLYKEVLDLFFASDIDNLILFGGRSSGKTDAVTSYLFKKLVEDNYRSVILRSAESALKSTNNEVMLNILDSMDIRNRFKISKTPFMFKYKNSHIMLLGLRREDIAQDKIKSLANYHVFVFEEADLFKESTFTTSELSLRGYDVRKVILIFNPPREGIYHWIYKRYFPPDYKDGHDKLTFYKNSLILHTSYMDCMYNPPGIIRTMEMLKDGDPYEYDRVVSGNFTFERRMRVYPKYDIVKDDHIYDDSICYYGVDWGFRDTMAIVEVWYSQSYNTLYIKNEWGKEGLDPDEVTEFLIQIPGITQNRVYADSASPAMIKMLRSWIPIKPVKKLQNSILNGIFRIRSMNIKVHESCKETIKEFGLYEWKPHPDDEKLANTSINPKDMHNHFMDAMRYALDRYIAKSPSLLDSMKGDIVRQWQ